jgi:hypothetical protein
VVVFVISGDVRTSTYPLQPELENTILFSFLLKR